MNLRVIGGIVLVAVSVEASLVPSNNVGTVAECPWTVFSGDEEAESVDENPNLIGEERKVGLKSVHENGEEEILPCILSSYYSDIDAVCFALLFAQGRKKVKGLRSGRKMTLLSFLCEIIGLK